MVLQKLNMPILANTTLNQTISYAGSITDNMIGAGFMGGGKDGCQGDSGGPIVVNDNRNYKVAGVSSFGTGCAQENYPGIYTRVSQYDAWIQNTTGLSNIKEEEISLDIDIYPNPFITL